MISSTDFPKGVFFDGNDIITWWKLKRSQFSGVQLLQKELVSAGDLWRNVHVWFRNTAGGMSGIKLCTLNVAFLNTEQRKMEEIASSDMFLYLSHCSKDFLLLLTANAEKVFVFQTSRV